MPKIFIPRKAFVGFMALAALLTLTAPQGGWAMLIPPQADGAASNANNQRLADIKTIQTALESKIVRHRLAEFKLTPQQIDSRMAQLSDEQLHQTAVQIRSVNPGGDGGLGILVALLVIGILVLLFVYLVKRV